jgi:hypothetical protein
MGISATTMLCARCAGPLADRSPTNTDAFCAFGGSILPLRAFTARGAASKDLREMVRRPGPTLPRRRNHDAKLQSANACRKSSGFRVHDGFGRSGFQSQGRLPRRIFELAAIGAHCGPRSAFSRAVANMVRP